MPFCLLGCAAPIKVSEDMVGAAGVSGAPSKDDCSQAAITHLPFGAVWGLVSLVWLPCAPRNRLPFPIFQLPLGASGQSYRRECNESRTTEALDDRARPNRSNVATFLGPKHGRRGERHCRFKKIMVIEQILLVVGAAGIEPATSPV